MKVIVHDLGTEYNEVLQKSAMWSCMRTVNMLHVRAVSVVGPSIRQRVI